MSILTKGFSDSRPQIGQLPIPTPTETKEVKPEEQRMTNEFERVEKEATDIFLRLQAEHPSFADKFWDTIPKKCLKLHVESLSRELALRVVKYGTNQELYLTSLKGLAEINEQTQIWDNVNLKVKNAIRFYGGRSARIVNVIIILDRDKEMFSSVADRASRLRESLFLKRALKDVRVSSDEMLSFYNLLLTVSLSDPITPRRRTEIERHKIAISLEAPPKAVIVIDQRINLPITARQPASAEALEVPVNEIIKESPSDILGVPANASRRVIEESYVRILAELDVNTARDVVEIFKLQKARETLIAGLNKEDDQEEASGKRQQVSEVLGDTRSRSFDMREPEKPSFLKWLTTGWRAFTASALAMAAALAAVFAEPREPVQPEHKVSSVQHVPLATPVMVEDDDEVDVEPDANTEMASAVQKMSEVAAASSIVKQEQLADISLTAGQTLWSVTKDLLKEHGLRPNNININHFNHQLLADNHLTVEQAERLPIGFVVHVGGVGKLMDELTGKISIEEAPKTPKAITADEPSTMEKTQDVASIIAASETLEEAPTASLAKLNLKGNPTMLAEMPSTYKAYSDLPNDQNTERALGKGEAPYKTIHKMLKARGLNWTTERINFFTQCLMEDNADRMRAWVANGDMKNMSEMWIPVGAKFDYSSVVVMMDDMEKAKLENRRPVMVKELAAKRGIKYPIMMKFPSL